MDFTFLYILNRLIQDLSDYGGSKEPGEESTSRVDSSVPLTHLEQRDLGLIC